jgi:hypothetical protein
MWVFQLEEANPQSASARQRPDEFRALVSQFSIPHSVAAVSYASGARIRKVRVGPPSRKTAPADPRVVILSRTLLKAARRQARPDAA